MASMNLAIRSVSDSSGSAYSADVRWLADSLPAGPMAARLRAARSFCCCSSCANVSSGGCNAEAESRDSVVPKLVDRPVPADFRSNCGTPAAADAPALLLLQLLLGEPCLLWTRSGPDMSWGLGSRGLPWPASWAPSAGNARLSGEGDAHGVRAAGSALLGVKLEVLLLADSAATGMLA